MRKILITFVPGLIAAGAGGYLGHLAAGWLIGQGRDAPMLPGALAGLACGFCSIDRSRVRAGLCALIALAAGLLSYWKLWSPPFETDGSFLDLIKNVHRLLPYTLIMLGLGTFLGFWWGRESTNPWRHRFATTDRSSTRSVNDE